MPILATGPQQNKAAFLEVEPAYKDAINSIPNSLDTIESLAPNKKLSDIYKSKINRVNDGELHKGSISRAPKFIIGPNISSAILSLECGGLRKEVPELDRKRISRFISDAAHCLTDIEVAERMTKLIQNNTPPTKEEENDLNNPKNLRLAMGEDRFLNFITRITSRMSQAAAQATAANNRLEELAYKPFREWKPLAKLVSFIPRQIRRQLVYGATNLIYCGILATVSYFMFPVAHIVTTPAFLAASISAIATLTGLAYVTYARLSVSGLFGFGGKANKLIDIIDYKKNAENKGELKFKDGCNPTTQQKLIFERYKDRLIQVIEENPNAGSVDLKSELKYAMKKDLCALFHGYRDAQLYKLNRSVFEHLKPDYLEKTDVTDLAKNAKSKAYRKTGETFYKHINRQYAKDETQRCIDTLMLSIAKGDSYDTLRTKVKDCAYVSMTGTYGAKKLNLIQAMEVLGYTDSEIDTIKKIQRYAQDKDSFLATVDNNNSQKIENNKTSDRYENYHKFININISNHLLRKYIPGVANGSPLDVNTFESEMTILKSKISHVSNLENKDQEELLRTLSILEDTTLLMPDDYSHPSDGDDKGTLRKHLFELKNAISDVLVWDSLNKANGDENFAGGVSPYLRKSSEIKRKYSERAHEALEQKAGVDESEAQYKDRIEKNAHMLLAYTNYANRGDEVQQKQKASSVKFKYRDLRPTGDGWKESKLTLPQTMVMSKMIAQTLAPALAFRDQRFVPNHLSMTDLRQFSPTLSGGSASFFNKVATASSKVADTLEAVATTADNSVELFKQLSSTLMSLVNLKKLSKDDVLLNALGNGGSWWVSSRTGVGDFLANNIELFTLGSLAIPIKLVASAINGSSRVLSTVPRLIEVACMAAAKREVDQVFGYNERKLQERNDMEELRLEIRRLGLQRGAHNPIELIKRIQKTETTESEVQIATRIDNATAGYRGIFQQSTLDMKTNPFKTSYAAPAA